MNPSTLLQPFGNDRLADLTIAYLFKHGAVEIEVTPQEDDGSPGPIVTARLGSTVVVAKIVNSDVLADGTVLQRCRDKQQATRLTKASLILVTSQVDEPKVSRLLSQIADGGDNTHLLVF